MTAYACQHLLMTDDAYLSLSCSWGDDKAQGHALAQDQACDCVLLVKGKK